MIVFLFLKTINMKKILFSIVVCLLFQYSNAQTKIVKDKPKTITKTTATSDDEGAVKMVLNKYKTAVESLDITGTQNLFTNDSKIYESGGSEGTYAHYMEHHMGPELKEFKSFTFNNYKIETTIDGNYAFCTETYNYVIVLAKDNLEVKRKGVATSVLKKIDGDWKITITHSSSRK